MNQRHSARTALRAAISAAVFAVHLQECIIYAWAPQYFSLARRNGAIIDARFANYCAIFSSERNAASSGPDNNILDDWREFRAQLVLSENENDVGTSPSSKRKSSLPDANKDGDRWAYETGDFVERGSIVVSTPSSNEILNDIDALNNVCYRKSIVLVLDVSPNFIQGIVLNRPTNIGVKEGMRFVQPGHGELIDNEMGSCLGDNCNIYEKDKPIRSTRWKVWFGGEAGGPFSDFPRVVCLHSLTSDSAIDLSDMVLPGIFITSFDNAEKLVKAGNASPSHFWMFCGICGWETSSFYREMHEEGLWHIVSADSGTILEELKMLRCEEEEESAVAQNCDIDHDPRNAGLHTWQLLMEKVGLDTEAHEIGKSFGDLMLHEWATGTLAFSVKEERSSMIMPSYSDLTLVDNSSDFDVADYDPAAAMPLENAQLQSSGVVGVMVRASSATRSPYLLSDQGFHKSVILILQDDDMYSEGIILNLVTERTLQLDLDGQLVHLPIRYGGPAYYSLGDEDGDINYGIPTIFLHSSKALKEAGIGAPVGKSRLFRCTREEVVKALNFNLATAEDIMVVQGSSIWTKKGEHTGILGDVEAGFFHLVPRPKIEEVWGILLRQTLLTEESLSSNTFFSKRAWNVASKRAKDDKVASTNDKVFGTDVDVATLADEAALRWVKLNLMTTQ